MKEKSVSYAGRVKEEAAGVLSEARHCLYAEAAAILFANGYLSDGALFLQTENEHAARKLFTILQKAFNIEVGFVEDGAVLHANGRIYGSFLDDKASAETVLNAIRAVKEDGVLCGMGDDGAPHPSITRSSCCKRAYLRDAFLCTGSMSDPAKGYHLEYVCHRHAGAMHLISLLKAFGIGGKLAVRGKTEVVYVKDGAEIAEFLNVIGAHRSLMALEDLRIYKEMRAGVNRRVNCDTANIAKTVNASARQVESIRFLSEHRGLKTLPEALRQAAKMRLDHPDTPLTELAAMMEPPMTKSGLNHRLQKLVRLADEEREKETSVTGK